jgi:SEL1 protein
MCAEIPPASRAYRQALLTLSTLTAHPPSYTQDYSSSTTGTSSSSSSSGILSSLLPNLQGHGPIGSAVRIAIKLFHTSWIARLTREIAYWTGFSGGSGGGPGGGGGGKRREETRGKAIKVVDLLQHSAELGNMDALYTLARLSMVRPRPCARHADHESLSNVTPVPTECVLPFLPLPRLLFL